MPFHRPTPRELSSVFREAEDNKNTFFFKFSTSAEQFVHAKWKVFIFQTFSCASVWLPTRDYTYFKKDFCPSVKEGIATNYMVNGITAMEYTLDIRVPKKFGISKAVVLKLGSSNPEGSWNGSRECDFKIE